MNILLRRKGFGLETLRALSQKMTSTTIIRNTDSIRSLRVPGSDNKALSWGYVNNCPSNVKQFNTSQAVGLISNKGLFREHLYANDLAMLTFTNYDEAKHAVDNGIKLIVRPRTHLGGRNLHLVEDSEQLAQAIRMCGAHWYASEYIPKVAEYRVFVIQNRVLWVVNKVVSDPSALAWNFEQGSAFDNVRFGSWDLNVMRSAILACKLAGLHYGAVDVIVDREGRSYVLEINSAPSITSEYRLDKTAKAFDMLLSSEVDFPYEHYGVHGNLTNWRHVIHPAASDEAETGTFRTTEAVDTINPEPSASISEYVKREGERNVAVFLKISHPRRRPEYIELLKYYPNDDKITLKRTLTVSVMNKCLAFAKDSTLTTMEV